MNPIRQATYSLLARLFLAPPDAELLQQLATLPPFNTTLQEVTIDADTVETYQVYYQELFGFNFFPYESLFHERELMVNTAYASRVARLMEQSGFDATPYAVGAVDHIGVQLAFMAFLIAQEREGTARHQAWMIEAARQYQATVIHQHLATWVPVAMLTMQPIAPAPLFHLLAEITLELVLSDVTAIPATEAIVWVEDSPTPSVPSDDEGEDDGLSSLIRHLITPLESGVFLTRTEIRRIARQLHLPMTMGDRFGMVKQLFEAAGQFDQIDPLLTALEQHWQQAEHKVISLTTAAPAWRSYGEVWLIRIKQGQERLSMLR
jgi:TorA maturation chaperone TorD